MRQLDEIIIHCTATREGQDVTIDQVRQWHTMPEPKGRGWSDVGYHFLIGLDGTIWEGRKLDKQGAHCKGHNEHSIGVCYVGGLDKEGKPKDTRTDAQKAYLVDLCFILMQNYHIDVDHVFVHNEFANKACPCFSGESFRSELNEYISEIL